MVAATNTSPPWGARPPIGLDPLSWSALIIFAGQCLTVALFGEFPFPFDEHAHFSYAWHVLQTGEILPSLDDLRLIDAGSLARWSDDSNYVNHPSAYYVLMAWAAASFGLSPDQLVLPWRLLNVALAVGGLALVLRLGQEAGWSAPAHAAFIVLIAFNPTLPVLGGIISNDNLAFFGGSLCCLGSFRLLSGYCTRAVWLTAGSGLLIAAFAKLTAALLCGLLLGCALAWLVAARGFVELRRWPAVFCLILCCLTLVPYLPFLLQYGSPAPFTAGQAAKFASRLAELPQWQGERLGLSAYVLHFLGSLLVYWPPITPVSRAQTTLLALPATCLILSLVGVLGAVVATRRRATDPTARFVICGVIAMTAMLAVHLEFTFARHQETGWLRGVYPRYYFPLLPILPAACAWLIHHCASRAQAWALAGLVITFSLCYEATYRLRDSF
jgi:hypothetical protein